MNITNTPLIDFIDNDTPKAFQALKRRRSLGGGSRSKKGKSKKSRSKKSVKRY